jgi:hypothetical protein
MPLDIAKGNELNKPSDVIVEESGDRILIKKKSNE